MVFGQASGLLAQLVTPLLGLTSRPFHLAVLDEQIVDSLASDHQLHAECQQEAAPKNYPTRGDLSTIDRLYTAVKKLYDYHLSCEFEREFEKYGR